MAELACGNNMKKEQKNRSVAENKRGRASVASPPPNPCLLDLKGHPKPNFYFSNNRIGNIDYIIGDSHL